MTTVFKAITAASFGAAFFCLGAYLVYHAGAGAGAGAGAAAYHLTDDYQPSPAVDRPVTDSQLVVGLAELTTDLNAELKATRAELATVKANAGEIINALWGEIERLRKNAGSGGTRVVPPNQIPAKLPTRPPMPRAT